MLHFFLLYFRLSRNTALAAGLPGLFGTCIFREVDFVVFLKSGFKGIAAILLLLFASLPLWAKIDYEWNNTVHSDGSFIDNDLSNQTIIYEYSVIPVFAQNNSPLPAGFSTPSFSGSTDIRLHADIGDLNELTADVRNWASNYDFTSLADEFTAKLPDAAQHSATSPSELWGTFVASSSLTDGPFVGKYSNDDNHWLAEKHGYFKSEGTDLLFTARIFSAETTPAASSANPEGTESMQINPLGTPVTWNGSVSSDWAEGENWVDEIAPTAADDVVIDGNYVNAPVLDLASGAITIKSLTLGENNESLLTISNADTDTKKLIVSGDLLIGGSGILTHEQNTTAEQHKLFLDVGGDLTIASGGKIDVSGKGYDVAQGPGKGVNNSYASGGAGHGGDGGNSSSGVAGGSTYGSVKEPITIGSGGGISSSSARTGTGGGAVKLTITNTIIIDGTIDASGLNGSGGRGDGGGSGGSVWITAGNISGSGSVQANGGSGSNTYYDGGGGGGGRISLAYDTYTSSFATLSAYGGSGPDNAQSGGAGTIFKKASTDTNGYLIANNNNQTDGAFTTTTESSTFDSITLSGNAKYAVASGHTIDFLDTILSGASTASLTINSGGVLNAPNITSLENISIYNNGIYNHSSSSLTIPSGVNWYENGTLSSIGNTQEITDIMIAGKLEFQNQNTDLTPAIFNSIIINNGGLLTHQANTDTQTDALNLQLSNLTIEAGGKIDVSGKGYDVTQGPGKGVNNSYASGGAGYGGNGGNSSSGVAGGSTYGSVKEPITIGSGGGISSSSARTGTGGGAVKLTITNTIIIDGTIDASGLNGSGGRGDGGGSGGSVWITAGNISGSGSVQANGGSGSNTYYDGGGGGGGRISLAYDTYTSSFATLSAYGGSGPDNAQSGGAGTIFKKASTDTNGYLIVNNNNQTDGAFTTTTESSTFDSITLSGNAKYAVASGHTIDFLDTILSGASTASLTINSGGVLNAPNITDLENISIYNNGIYNHSSSSLTIPSGVNWYENGTLSSIGNTQEITDIVIAGKLEFQNQNTDLTPAIFNSIIINNGGLLTHQANTDTQTDALNLQLSNLTIEAGGKIDVSGKGYDVTQGPGKGVNNSYASGGAGYGGNGGNSSSGVAGGSTYGSVKEPITIGSGGGISSSSARTGTGGGAVKLTITNTIIIDGTIDASGLNGSGGRGDGGGSGGSVWITAGNISGSGSVQANGGSGSNTYYDGGGGGGGRISLAYDTYTSSFATLSAYGGSGPDNAQSGGAGTIFKKASTDTNGYLIVNNNNQTDGAFTTTTESSTFDSITLSGNAKYAVASGHTIDFLDTILSGASTASLTINSGGVLNAPNITSLENISIYNNGIYNHSSSSLTIPSGVNWYENGTLSSIGNTQEITDIVIAGKLEFQNQNTDLTPAIFNSIIINNGGLLTHQANTDTQTDALNLQLSNLTIEAGGKIDVSGKGYDVAQGPGKGVNNSYASGGAGYGGNGGNSSSGVAGGSTYGSLEEPITIGSGGGISTSSARTGKGGGAVKLTITNTITIDGTIDAGGLNGSGGRGDGGGSGGSVWITAGNISGSGSVQANGGSGSNTYYDGGGGGGGRIALAYATSTLPPENIFYSGGIGLGGAEDGEEGTLFIGVIWDGSASSDWAEGENWKGGIAPTATDDVVIDGNYDNAPIINLSSGEITINSLTLGTNNTSLLTVSNGDSDTKKLIVTNDVFIGGNGTLTHEQNTTPEEQQHKLFLEVGRNLTVEAGGSIDVSGKGYQSGEGFGPGTSDDSGGGGAYGGNGGDAGRNGIGGQAYGSISAPVSIGSGGGNGYPHYQQSGGLGGGAIKITVLGTATINGTISADGDIGTAYASNSPGGGSGGSIWLDFNTAQGTGNITSNGGNGLNNNYGGGGGGGGGRIAIYFQSSTLNSFSAYGGYGYQSGGAGTIFKKASTDTYGHLAVANNEITNGVNTPCLESITFDSINLSENANYLISSGNTVNLEDVTIASDITTFLIIEPGAIFNASNLLTLENLSVINSGKLNLPGVTTLSNLSFTNNGIYNHSSSILTIPSGVAWYENGTRDAIGDDQAITDFIIEGTFEFQNQNTLDGEDPVIFNTIIINSGGVLTHQANADSQTDALNMELNTLTINSDGAIDLSGKGYASAKGPGAGISDDGGGGGAYGGNGGDASRNGIGGQAYGIESDPVSIGSGGGNGYPHNKKSGGLGGGAVKLKILGTATINGIISADGNNGTSYSNNGSGGGSGGSIWLNVITLQGTGNISSNGGNGLNKSYFGGGGGGGRIALAYSSNTLSFENISYSGGSGFENGGEGTLYSQVLRIWDGSESSDWSNPLNWDIGVTPTATNDIVIDGNYTNAPVLDLAGGAVTIGSLILGENNESLLTISNGDTDTKKLIITIDVTIGGNGTLTHTANSTTEAHKLFLEVGGNLTIASGGQIDVNEKGYQGTSNSGSSGYGPGAGDLMAGGGYGGVGGWAGSYYPNNYGGVAYGSVTEPTDLGSSGGSSNNAYSGRGGGAMKISVSGTMNLEGNILARGGAGYGGGYGGGSAGGSVWITTENLTGSGLISVNGGNGDDELRSGSGSGGRIALYYTDKSGYTGSVTAYGGTVGSAQAQRGSAGTIYLKGNTQTHGDLIIDNNGVSGANTEAAENTTFDNITIQNGGNYTVTETHTITLNASSMATTSDASLTIESGGTFQAPNLTSISDFQIVNNSTFSLPAILSPSNSNFTMTNNGVYNHTSPTLTIPSGVTWYENGTESTIGDTQPITDIVVEGTLEFQNQNTDLTPASFESITINNGGVLTHQANSTTQTVALNLNLGELTINEGGAIDVSGKGYKGGTGRQGNGYGPGGGLGIQNYAGGGAGHGGGGGSGGNSSYGGAGGDSYGSVSSPLTIGSGGGNGNYGNGGSGGGAIKLIVNGGVSIEGEILADGGDGGPGNDSGGGGAGGSIWMSATEITGIGYMSAGGGDGATAGDDGGGGGGGRISLTYASSTLSFSSLALTGGTGFENGEDGTIYIFAPPDPVTNIEPTVSNAQIDLTWVAPTNPYTPAVTDYYVYYKQVEASGWTRIEPDPETSETTASISGLTNGTGYDVKVIAINDAGQSDPAILSNIIPYAPPEAPTNVEAQVNDDGLGNVTVELTFDPPADDGGGVEEYLIYIGDTDVATPWYNSSWSHRSKLTIPAENINEELANFPVYVNLSDLGEGFFQHTQNNGGDIRVTTDDGTTEVPRELVFCDIENEEGELHFKANLSNTDDNVFYIYYGNASENDYPTNHEFGAYNVWDDGYEAIFHLEEDGNNNANGYKDSSGNGNNGTGFSMTADSDISGALGKGQTFDGSLDYISFGQTGLSAGYDERTLSLWTKMNSIASLFHHAASYGSPSNGNAMFIGAKDDILLGGGYGGTLGYDLELNDFWNITEPKHLALTYDGSIAKLYEGETELISQTQNWNLVKNKAYIGRLVNDSDYWNGWVDEVRISSVVRSSAWISVEHQNQSSPNDFYTISAGLQLVGSGDGGNTNPLSITISGLTLGETYSFTATAVNGAGESVPSAPSEEVTIDYLPDPVTNLEATISDSQIDITWVAPENTYHPPNYLVEYKESTATNWIDLFDPETGTSETNASIPSLINGTKYDVRVAAFNGTGTSLYTTLDEGTTPYVTPDPPTGLNATVQDDASVIVNFVAPEIDGGGVVEYRIYTDEPDAAWYNAAWSGRSKLTILAENIDENLEDFPVYVNLNNLGTEFFNSTQNNGGDIRITNSTGTEELPRELVFCDIGNEQGELHFKANLSNTYDNVFYIYYGNASASDYDDTNPMGSNLVWSNNFFFVSHNGGGSDSSGKNTNQDIQGGVEINGIGGELGKATSFDGSNDYIEYPYNSSTDVDYITMAVWLKKSPVAGGNSQAIIQKPYTSHNAPYYNFDFTYVNNSLLYYDVTINNAWSQVSMETNLSSTEWEYFVMSYDGSYRKVYKNGGQLSSSINPIGVLNKYATPLGIAGFPNLAKSSSYLYKGAIDEIRLSSIARSQEWIETEHANQSSPNDFYTISAGLQLVGSVDGNTNPLSITISGLTLGETYSFTATAVNGAGESAPSAPSNEVTIYLTPDPVENLEATALDSEIRLTWEPPLNTTFRPVLSYTIQYRESGPPSGDWITFEDVDSDVFSSTITELINGKSYAVQVAAVNSTGTGDFEEISDITPIGLPKAPEIVETVVTNDGSVTITFTEPDNNGAEIVEYQLFAKTSSETDYTEKTTTTELIATIPVADLILGESYTFTVKAINAAGESDLSTPSDEVTVDVLPGPVTGLEATALDSQIDLTWVAPGNTTLQVPDYVVEYKESSEPETAWTRIDPDPVKPDTDASITGLTNGTAYDVRVAAKNDAGISSYASLTNISPIGPALPPTGLSFSILGGGEMQLSWEEPGNTGGVDLTDYIIKYKEEFELDFIEYPDGVSTTTSATISGLDNDQNYDFYVIAVNSEGESLPSEEIPVRLGEPGSISALGMEDTVYPEVIGIFEIENLGSQDYDYQYTWAITESATNTCGGGNDVAGAYDGVISLAPGATYEGRPLSTIVPLKLENLPGYEDFEDLGMTLFFHVQIEYGFEISSDYYEFTLTSDFVEPGKPIILAKTPGDRNVQISWLAPIDNGGDEVIRYRIEYKPSEDGTWLNGGQSTGTARTVSGLVNGVKYDFQVYAENVIGEGEPSDIVSETPVYRPKAPTGLAASKESDTSILFSWSEPGDTGGLPITDYIIEYRKYNGSWSGWITYDDGVSDAKQATLTGLEEDFLYQLRVSARNALGVGRHSGTVQVTLGSKPTAPRLTTDTRVEHKIDLSISPPTDSGETPILDYQIEYKEEGGEWGIFADDVNTNSSITVPDLTTGVTYYFRVAAINNSGMGPYSNEVEEVPATLPGAPTNVVATANADGEIFLSFEHPEFDGYDNIDRYQSLSSPLGRTASSMPIRGMTIGETFTFQVCVRNSIGYGPYSEPSNEVTPYLEPELNFTGPTRGPVLVESSSFSVIPNQRMTGTVTITPSGAAAVGIDPIVIDLNNTSTRQSFTIRPEIEGNITLTMSNDQGWRQERTVRSYNATPHVVLPDPPENIAAEAGNGYASISFDPPLFDGNAPLTQYVVFCDPGNIIVPGTGSPIIIPGLTYGETYTFYAEAVNSAGASLPSFTVQARLPDEPPALAYSFTGPEGGDIYAESAEFTITPEFAFTDDITVEFYGLGAKELSPLVFSFADDITPQTFTITPQSAGDIVLLPRGTINLDPIPLTYNVEPIPPGAPVIKYAIPQNGAVDLTWDEPLLTGGAEITDYKIEYRTGTDAWTEHEDDVSTDLFTTVSGLINGTIYEFRIIAVNALGVGEPSDPVFETPYDAPTADAGADKSVDCHNPSVQIGTPATPGFTYAWTPTAGLDNANIAQPTATPDGTTTYSLVVTEEATGYSSEGDEVVVVHNTPDNSYTLTGSTVCSGGNATITMSDYQDDVSYQLYKVRDDSPVGPSQTGSADEPVDFMVINPTVTLEYYVVATHTPTGCATQLSNTATVTVNPLPDVTLTYGIPNTPPTITEQIPSISTSAIEAWSVYSTDIDGDGHMDVLYASNDGKIAWYKNTDGAGTFGAEQTISTNVIVAFSVYAIDIDGDNDMDVLSASYQDNKIAWYENTDGAGTFGAQNVISTDANRATSVYSTDLDGDGDMDVLSSSFSDNKIAWYENDGTGNFGSQIVISTAASGATSVYATDMDGDGDMDVLSASWTDNKIAWYENTDGAGTFGAQNVISTVAMNASSVYATDMDGDGDMDVLSASNDDHKIAWYENTDGDGTFGAQQVISTAALRARSVYATDLDGDGDMDVLSASYADNKIAWYKNTDGDGTFGAQQVISTAALGAISVYATDIDGDGDMDVLSASSTDDKIAWYKNDLLQPQCDGDIQFNEVGDDATGWTWTSSNAGVSFAPNNTVQNPIATGIADGDEITVEVSDGTCTNTTSATISINLLPDDSFSVTGESIESGESATISQSGSEADVEYQLRYHSDSTNVPGISPKTQTGGSEFLFDAVSPTSTTEYNVLATSTITGCSVQLLATATVTVTDIPLPVELLTFMATDQLKSVKLDWTTASETDNDYFSVERSLDGEFWSEIGQVKGSGTTTSVTAYTFTDHHPVVGYQYYRLRQVDFDGEFEYSKVILVLRSGDSSFALEVYPVPLTSEELFLATDGDAVITGLTLVDATGKQTPLVVNSVRPGLTSTTIRQTAGVYVIIVDTSKGQIRRAIVVY
jgi:hypothetical protein